MRNIVKQNKQFLLAFFGVLLIILSCSIFVSNSEMLMEEVAIKSITPIYDEEGTYSVGNTGVIFNDKDQVVKYNIVIENRKNYDVKVSDLQLGTKSEEFLNYTVENINLDDVIKAGESKELVVSFETVKMDGWGRNFNDELVTTLVFDEVEKQEEVVVPPVVDTKPNTNVPTNKVENNTSNNVQPEVNEPVIEQPKEEVKDEVVTTPEDDVNHELGMNQKIIVKDAHNEDLFVIFCFGVATGVLGIGLVMVNKNKFTKYIVLFVIVGSSVKLAQADEIMSLEIPINVSYESQNVMRASGFDASEGEFIGSNSFWPYNNKIKNFYIENEMNEIENYVYKFDASEKGNEKVIAYIVDSSAEENVCYDYNANETNCYDLYLQADGLIYSNIDASGYFAETINLQQISNLTGLETGDATDMSYMFANAGARNPNFKLDLSELDTSNVTNMSYMFLCTAATIDNFVLNVSVLDTSKVTDMSFMFYQAGTMGQNFVLDVSELDTSSVTNMNGMFLYTGYDSTNFTLDVSNFDTSNVTNMNGMFLYTGTMSRNIMLDVSNFDTSNVTNMNAMFGYVGIYNEQFTLDVSNFDTSNVIHMSNMFYNTGYSSQNFNTKFTIRNANIENYKNVFTNVATKPGSQITVHYTTETETLVDEMIASLSPNSNVVKGWNEDECITFTIGDTTYNAIEGMTWEQWVNSEFNTDGYYISYDSVKKEENPDSYVLVANGDDGVSNYSEIVENHSYTLGNLPPC